MSEQDDKWAAFSIECSTDESNGTFVVKFHEFALAQNSPRNAEVGASKRDASVRIKDGEKIEYVAPIPADANHPEPDYVAKAKEKVREQASSND